MIKFHEQVPSVYPSASRDFQYFCWLINVVLNDVKHNVDSIYNLPNTKTDPKIAELLAMTLGFKIKRNYDQSQLAALASVIPTLLKYKGTKKAIEIAGNVLIKTSGTTGKFSCDLKNKVLEIVLPKDLIDITLFIDLLPYILPAGLTCKILRKTQLDETLDKIELVVSNAIKADWEPDAAISKAKKLDVGHDYTGLSELFDIDNNSAPVFANYDNNSELNTGLLDNTVIPVLYEHSYEEPDTSDTHVEEVIEE
jgi:hypothetical protein